MTQTGNTACFKGFTDLTTFSRVSPFGNAETDYLSPEMDAGMDFNEVVASWDVDAKPGAQISVSARAIYPDHQTKFYVLGVWSPDPKAAPRTSIDGQKDADGTVNTDTLALNQKARKLQLLVVAKPGPDGSEPHFRFLGVCYSDTTSLADPQASPPAEVTPIDVPEKCQGSYPGGGGWCSPTSVSMVLNYWGAKLNRPDLDKDVPEVAGGVFDQDFGGTGNWPFNTAYAGSFPGMRAYITRFSTVDEVRAWVDKGFPVITSGSLPLLEGKERYKGDPGHLVVLVGFDKSGDPIFNDPAHQQVRKTYKLSDFENSWNSSNRTVYLIYPENMSPPTDTMGHWFSG